MSLSELKNSYLRKKNDIENRIKEFQKEKSDDEIFKELAFCLLTPQSKAKTCWTAIEKLAERNLLFSDSDSIRPLLSCVRFGNNKAKYIVNARNIFNETMKRIRANQKPEELRDYLVENVRGMGYKESSHFLRNIGFLDFAILDRHILKNLKKYGVIKEVPKSLTPKRYLEIEEKMKEFSNAVKIPLSHLDLLFWSNETGEIFK